jgi:hypothetical protein
MEENTLRFIWDVGQCSELFYVRTQRLMAVGNFNIVTEILSFMTQIFDLLNDVINFGFVLHCVFPGLLCAEPYEYQPFAGRVKLHSCCESSAVWHKVRKSQYEVYTEVKNTMRHIQNIRKYTTKFNTCWSLLNFLRY